jgi:membrane protein YfhO
MGQATSRATNATLPYSLRERVFRSILSQDDDARRDRSQIVPWTRKADLTAIVLLCALGLLYAWMRVVRDPDYFAGDIVTQFLPYYSVLGERLRAGDIPGWNPAIFSGMPFAGDPISGWGYIPAMTVFPFLAPITAYKLFITLHLVATAVAAYFLGRVLGMGPIGASATGAAYLLGPQFRFAQCCTARMQLVPWFAIALAGVVLATRSQTMTRRILWWGVTGLSLSQMIAGYFGKGFYYGFIAIGALLAYQVLFESTMRLDRRLIWLGIHGAAIYGIGLGLSAMTLLPRLDFLDRSNLQGGSYDAAGEGAARSPAWSLARTVGSLIDPRMTSYSLGTVTVLLAIAAVVLAGRRCSAPFFAIYTLVVIILTLEPTPLHQVMYLIPKFKTLHEHHPHRILTVLNIGPAVLVGITITAVERRWASARRLLLGVFAIGAGAVIAGLIVRKGEIDLAPSLTKAALIAGGALLAAAGLIVLARNSGETGRRRVAAGSALMLLALFVVVVDAGRGRAAIQGGWTNPPTGPIGVAYADQGDANAAGAFLLERQAAEGPSRFYGYDAAYLLMHANGGGRNYRLQWRNLDAEALLVNNRAMLLDLYDAQGYTPAHPMDYVRWIDTANGRPQEYHETDVLPSGLSSPLLNLLNVRYIVLPATVPPGRPDLLHLNQRYPTVYLDDQVRIVENGAALPRAWVVSNAQQATFHQATDLIRFGRVDPTETVLLETEPALAGTSPGAAGDPGRANITSFEPDQIVYQVDATQAGYFVASEPYDPGWHAYVDGKRVPLLRANGLLRAIQIPSGSHVVEMRYEPRSLQVGIAISIAAALTWLGALILSFLLATRVRGRRVQRSE